MKIASKEHKLGKENFTMNDFGTIELEHQNINLNAASFESLQELLKKVSERELVVKQDIDEMLKNF